MVSLEADAVVLASGGFEANTEWRARYLGAGWDLAKVRGSRFNTGDGIRMALDVGAMPYGNWSGCHAVGWDRNAPDFGDLAVGDGFQKHSYPFGIMINANGERFVDEGADFRNYTYAKYGGEILKQPGQFAWQIFDAKTTHLLRDEYHIREITKAKADSLEALLPHLDGVDAATLPELADYSDALGAGSLCDAYARRWPELASATPLFLGLGDGAAANIGSKCTSRRRIAVTVGTSAATRVTLAESDIDDATLRAMPFGLWCYRIDRRELLLCLP